MDTVTVPEGGLVSTEHDGPDAGATLVTVPEGVNAVWLQTQLLGLNPLLPAWIALGD